MAADGAEGVRCDGYTGRMMMMLRLVTIRTRSEWCFPTISSMHACHCVPASHGHIQAVCTPPSRSPDLPPWASTSMSLWVCRQFYQHLPTHSPGVHPKFIISSQNKHRLRLNVLYWHNFYENFKEKKNEDHIWEDEAAPGPYKEASWAWTQAWVPNTQIITT